jgi:hypothetical protein
MIPLHCLKTSRTNYLAKQCHVPEEQTSYLFFEFLNFLYVTNMISVKEQMWCPWLCAQMMHRYTKQPTSQSQVINSPPVSNANVHYCIDKSLPYDPTLT